MNNEQTTNEANAVGQPPVGNRSAAPEPMAPTPGSASKVQFEVQGQRKQDPSRWDSIGAWPTEAEARADEKDYRDWSEAGGGKGWLDFRVVRVTTAFEVLPPPIEPGDGSCWSCGGQVKNYRCRKCGFIGKPNT